MINQELPKPKEKDSGQTEIIEEIKRIRNKYPNLGPEKIYPLLLSFCEQNQVTKCPKPRTIARIIADNPKKNENLHTESNSFWQN